MSTLTEVFTGIADAIREKEGSTGTIPVSDMASRISAIETGSGIYEGTITKSWFDGIGTTSGLLSFNLPVPINKLIAFAAHLSFADTGDQCIMLYNKMADTSLLCYFKSTSAWADMKFNWIDDTETDPNTGKKFSTYWGGDNSDLTINDSYYIAYE